MCAVSSTCCVLEGFGETESGTCYLQRNTGGHLTIIYGVVTKRVRKLSH
jgi:hypothetical protein